MVRSSEGSIPSPMSMFWINKVIQDRIKFNGNSRVRIYRNFKSKTVTVDWFGGACSTYTYDGEWIAG